MKNIDPYSVKIGDGVCLACLSEQTHCEECQRCRTAGLLRHFRARESTTAFEVCQNCFARLTETERQSYERSGMQYLTLQGLIRGEQLSFHMTSSSAQKNTYDYLLRNGRTDLACYISLPQRVEQMNELLYLLLRPCVLYCSDEISIAEIRAHYHTFKNTKEDKDLVDFYAMTFEKLEPILTRPIIKNMIQLYEKAQYAKIT